LAPANATLLIAGAGFEPATFGLCARRRMDVAPHASDVACDDSIMGVQLRYRPFEADALLEEPSATQLRILEFIAEGFFEHREWPVFDWVQGHFEAEGINVWNELRSLPVHPNGYYAVALPTNREPDPDARVPLTMIGLFQAEVMGRAHTHLDRPFLQALNVLAELRRDAPRTYNAPRAFKILSRDLLERLSGVPDQQLTPRGLSDLLSREPPTWGGSLETDDEGNWVKSITRDVLPFYGVTDLRDYLDRLVETLALPAVAELPATPSPLGLVAAIDCLDTVWRLAQPGAGHLFQLNSAQATAQLAFDANTPAEFESRMSGLGDVLRSYQLPAAETGGEASATSAGSAGKKPKRRRGKPLGPLEKHLAELLPESGQRIESAVAVLHHVIDVRDAGQHAPARGKGASALAALGVGYPPTSATDAWSTITARTIEALNALREELATLT
jgi:hypothetical protein